MIEMIISIISMALIFGFGAVVQAVGDRTAAAPGTIKDSQGYYYSKGAGGTRVYCGAGTPHGVIGAATNKVPLGSQYIETVTGVLYTKTSTTADTTWSSNDVT